MTDRFEEKRRKQKLTDANYILAGLNKDREDDKRMWGDKHPMSFWKYAISNILVQRYRPIAGDGQDGRYINAFNDDYLRSMFDIILKEFGGFDFDNSKKDGLGRHPKIYYLTSPTS